MQAHKMMCRDIVAFHLYLGHCRDVVEMFK